MESTRGALAGGRVGLWVFRGSVGEPGTQPALGIESPVTFCPGLQHFPLAFPSNWGQVSFLETLAGKTGELLVCV